MKNGILLTALLCLTTNLYSQNRPEVIYGEDGRIDVYDSKDPLFTKLSRSTVALMRPANVSKISGSEDYQLKGKTFQEGMNVCEEERFAKQPSYAFCSGFLVGPDLIVTAGHCMRGISACQKTAFVFDFKMKSEDEFDKKISGDNVYFCEKIISMSPSGNNDHALIKLRRTVKGRIPLLMRKEGDIAKGDPLMVIGHPSGIPTKLADGAAVRSANENYFKANLDTYGGNSGSAVFNMQSAKVEGILVRGETDFVRAPGKRCQISNICEDDECMGEDVTKISAVSLFDKVLRYQKKFYDNTPKAKSYAKKVYNLRKKKRPYYRDQTYTVRGVKKTL